MGEEGRGALLELPLPVGTSVACRTPLAKVERSEGSWFMIRLYLRIECQVNDFGNVCSNLVRFDRDHDWFARLSTVSARLWCARLRRASVKGGIGHILWVLLPGVEADGWVYAESDHYGSSKTGVRAENVQ